MFGKFKVVNTMLLSLNTDTIRTKDRAQEFIDSIPKRKKFYYFNTQHITNQSTLAEVWDNRKLINDTLRKINKRKAKLQRKN